MEYYSAINKNTLESDGDCSHEIKRHLLLGRKVMTNLDSIFKSRDITLPAKVHLVKSMFRGPAPVDPGNSKGGRRWHGKTCLLIDIRLD